MHKIRSIAFYLPQFHPVRENDEWWGRGFTEWTNVSKAVPKFRGHYQPHIPRDLGYYDLRLPETRAAQAHLARSFGVSGFCYYHYWFNGRRLLERPFSEVLRSGEPDFPFMLCWANENWTRVWDGGSKHVLLHQSYSQEDDRRHIRSLFEAFRDPRYIRVDDKPALAVYNVHSIPDPAAMASVWREEMARAGFKGIYLCQIEAFGPKDPGETSFDAAIEFMPNFLALPPRIRPGRVGRAARRIFRPNSGYRWNNVYEYAAVKDCALAVEPPGYLRYRCVMPGWDNSARRSEWALIVRNSTPELYRDWLERVAADFQPPSPEENFIFVNAWNEWAEGAHLEPDQRWGLAYLKSHASALQSLESAAGSGLGET